MKSWAAGFLWMLPIVVGSACSGPTRTFHRAAGGSAGLGAYAEGGGPEGGSSEAGAAGSPEGGSSEAGAAGSAGQGDADLCIGVVCSNVDSNACTTETCEAGVCISGAAKSCPAPAACHTQGSCNVGTGECSTPSAVDHASCGTNLECLGGTCQCTTVSCPNGCCTGGTCSACTPTTLATRSVSVQSLTIGSQLLYFLEGHAENSPVVYSLATTGGNPQEISVPPPTDSTLNLILADGSYIYGASFNNNRVARMPIIGGTFSLLTDSNSYNAQAIRANSTSLFTGYGLSSAAINVFPKGGGAPTPIIESLTLNTAHFAVDDSFLYFISAGPVISRAPVTGGGATTIMAAEANESTLNDVALSGNQVVFASSTRVGKVIATGGTAAALDTGSAYALLTDATMAYFFRAKSNSATCASGSDLFGIPVAGGALRRIATDPTASCARSVVHDASAVYWLSDKAIKKMPK